MQTWYNEVSVFNSASIDTFRWVIFKNISSSSYTNDDHQFCFAVFHLQLFFCSFSPSTFFAVFYLQLFFCSFSLAIFCSFSLATCFAVFSLLTSFAVFHLQLFLEVFHLQLFWKFFACDFFLQFFTCGSLYANCVGWNRPSGLWNCLLQGK